MPCRIADSIASVKILVAFSDIFSCMATFYAVYDLFSVHYLGKLYFFITIVYP